MSPSPPATSTPSDLRASVDWVVISALLCAVAALSFLAWHFWENRSTGEPVDVVLTDMAGTGDPVLDRALGQVLRVDLSQSPLLTVVPPSQERATPVCDRPSAQMVLHGAVSKSGQHYLVTLLATHCAPGATARSDATHAQVLAQAKEEVQRLDDLPQALGLVAADIRRSLGESRASIRRLDQPLRIASSGPFAALKAYSEGYELGLRGNWAGALPLLQHALELDPQFALAYHDLAVTYRNLQDVEKERAALIKAYELRATVPELQQLQITALYHSVITGDTAKSIETYTTWATLYPRSAEALGNLAIEYDSVGQANLAVAPASRAVELHPSDPAAYQTLALTQLHSGQLKAAQKTCELALRNNFDGADIRHLLLLALYAQNDTAGVTTQLEWGRNHPDSLRLQVDDISVALSKGEVQRAQALLAQLRARQYPSENAAEYQSDLASIARSLAELSLTSASLELLKSLPAAVTQDRNALIAMAESGNVAESDAERIPEARSALLLAKHEPQQAVHALEPALPFDGLTFGPAYLRGQAYLALGKPELAQTEFRKITEHLYVDPLSAEYPLALLASARAYVLQNQSDQAREQLERFLDLWKSADADLPLLQAARAEYESSPVDVSLRPD